MEYSSLIIDKINQKCRRLCINFDAFSGDLDVLQEAIGLSKSISILEVKRSSLGPRQYACVGSALLKNESIQSLDVQRCKLQEDGHSVLTDSLAKPRAPLRRFVFKDCKELSDGNHDSFKTAAAILQRSGVQSFDGEYGDSEISQGLEAADGSFSLLKAKLVPGSPPLAIKGVSLIRSLSCNTCLTELSIDCHESKSAESFCRGLKANNALRRLSLWDATDENTLMSLARVLPHNHTLEELSIEGLTMNGALMEAWGQTLATNSTLRKLKLDSMYGSTTGMVPLARGIREGAMKGALRLESLHICASTQQLDEFVTVLGEALACPRGCSLRKLHLRHCEISRDGFDNLLRGHSSAGSGLRELFLSDCNVDSDGAKLIAARLSLPACVLEKLVLIDCKIEDDGAMALGDALAVNSTLKDLCLPEEMMGSIGSKGGHAIAVGLQSNSTLQELDLNWTGRALGGQTPVALGRALGENPGIALRRLDIASCGLQPEGVVPLAAGLAGNTTLRELSISVELSEKTDYEAGVLFEAAARHPTLQWMQVRDALVSAASAPFVARLLSESASLRRLMVFNSRLPEAAARALLPAIASSRTCKVFEVGFVGSGWSKSIVQGMYQAAVQSGSMSEMTVGGRTKIHEDMLGLHRHMVVRRWMDQQLETDVAHSSDPGPSTAASIPTTSPKPRVLAGRAVAAMHLAAEGGAVDLAQVAAFVASCMDTIRGSMGRPVGVGEGGRDPGTMAMVSLVLGMGDACQAEYDEVERDRDGVPVVEELPMLRYALRDGRCLDRVRDVQRWAMEIDYPGLAGLCGETLALEETDRRRHVLRWRRAVEAKRDAGRVFRAASEGRPLELGKRLRLGRLAGGLEMKGEVQGGAMVGPLEAARLGGHEECVKVLEEVIGIG